MHFACYGLAQKLKTKKRKTKNTKHILQLYCGSIKKVGDKTNL